MHELSIARGIIQIVEAEAREKGFARVLEIDLRSGEFSGLMPQCLREFFPIAAEGSRAQGARLNIETVPAVFRCLGCGYEGGVDRKAACCPVCGGTELKMLSGREFYVDKLKVE